MRLATLSGILTGVFDIVIIFLAEKYLIPELYLFSNGLYALFFGIVWLAPRSTCARRPAALYLARFWTMYRSALIPIVIFERYSNAVICIKFAVIFLCTGMLKNYVSYIAFELEAMWWHGGFIVDDTLPRTSCPCFRRNLADFSLKVHRDNLSESNQTSGIQNPFQGLQLTGNSAEALVVARDGLEAQAKVPLLNFVALRIFPQRLLGAGSSARVYRGRFRGVPCAAKLLFTVDISPEEIQRCCDEASLLFAIQKVSVHVVGLIGVAILPPSLCVVLELCSEGSLSDVLYKRRNGVLPSEQQSEFSYRLPWEDRLELAVGAAKGVCAVSKALPGYSHNDIKSANFLVHRGPSANTSSLSSTALVVKIADVEFASKGVTPPHLLSWSTPNWTAPEVLSGTRPVSPKSDVFSLGCVLFEIFARRFPFGEEPDGKKIAEAIIKGIRPSFPENDSVGPGNVLDPLTSAEIKVKTQFRAVVEVAWSQNFGERPDPSEVVSCLEQNRDEFLRTSLSAMNKTRRASETRVEKDGTRRSSALRD